MRQVYGIVCAGIVLVIGLAADEIAAQERTSENNDRLKQLLKEYPQADADRDGVLTIAEVRAFTAQRRSRVAQQASRLKAWYEAHPRTQTGTHYGPHERQVFDFWQAKGEGLRPLVIYIHGGGWVGGDKEKINPTEIERLLAAGVSVASISYRYSTIAPFPAPIRDAGRAVQYLRHHAEKFGIDPERVACYGRSAGATSSLWLAYHDDLAEPMAEDPVLRQSTRLTCAGAIAAPTTLDKATMDEWFGMKVATHSAIYPFYAVTDEAELYSERIKAIAAEASPINHLSQDDPPVFLDYQGREKPLAKEHSAGEVVHHALLGKKLKAAADDRDIEVLLHTREAEFSPETDLIGFLIERLQP